MVLIQLININEFLGYPRKFLEGNILEFSGKQGRFYVIFSLKLNMKFPLLTYEPFEIKWTGIRNRTSIGRYFQNVHTNFHHLAISTVSSTNFRFRNYNVHAFIHPHPISHPLSSKGRYPHPVSDSASSHLSKYVNFYFL